jgi:Ca2+-binding EF-hand superfamily protein
MTPKDCTFLVNMINQAALKAIPYEQFIDFVIP